MTFNKKSAITLSAVVVALATMGSSVVGLVRTFNDVPEKKADLAYELFKDQTKLMVEDLLHTRTRLDLAISDLETAQQEITALKEVQAKCVCRSGRVVLRDPSTFSSFGRGRLGSKDSSDVSVLMLPPPAPPSPPSQSEAGLKSLPDSLNIPTQ